MLHVSKNKSTEEIDDSSPEIMIWHRKQVLECIYISNFKQWTEFTTICSDWISRQRCGDLKQKQFGIPFSLVWGLTSDCESE